MTDDAVRVLADRDEIHDIMMRYSHGVDQREMEIVRACFAPDLKTVGWGPLGEGFDRDALIRFISGVGHFRETMHMMGNQLIEVSGDTASMDTFAQLTHRLDGDPEKLLVSSRYVEKLTRRDGEWAITPARRRAHVGTERRRRAALGRSRGAVAARPRRDP